MFSRYYLFVTSSNEGKSVLRVQVTPEPGVFRRLIPEGYKGKSLPLWQFVLLPKDWKEQ
jgi:hypothetical protein